MLRNLACASVVLAASLGFAMAEPVKGRITSIEGNKLTATVGAKKGEKGESKTYDLAKDVKVNKGGKDGKTDLPGGLKAEELKKIDATKGVSAVLEVTGNTVSEITITTAKKKKE